jgi:hypothetical protein
VSEANSTRSRSVAFSVELRPREIVARIVSSLNIVEDALVSVQIFLGLSEA